MTKKIIQVFSVFEGTAKEHYKEDVITLDSSGGCCSSDSMEEVSQIANSGCGCSGGGPSIEMSIDAVSKSYGDVYAIDVFDPSKMDKKQFVDKLNHVLKVSGERLVIKDSTYEFAISKVLPLIAVEDKIIAVNTVPSATEIHDAINTGIRIKAKKGCC